MAQLLRAKSAFETCVSHINSVKATGEEIEFFLAQHLLIIICAEIQENIYSIVEDRAKGCSDLGLGAFAVGASKKILRSIKVGEITGFLGAFGSESRELFSAALDDRVIFQYNAAVENRHSVAHRGGVQMTLSDIGNVISVAESVLESVGRALGVVVEAVEADSESAAGDAEEVRVWESRLAEARHWSQLNPSTHTLADVERCEKMLAMARGSHLSTSLPAAPVSVRLRF